MIMEGHTRDAASASEQTGAMWMTSGNIATAAAQAAFLLFTTKFLGAEHAGRLAYATTLATQVLLLTGFQLRLYQASDQSDGYSLGAYFTLRNITGCLALALLAAAAVAHGLSSETGLLVIIIGATRWIEALAEIVFGHHQRARRFKIIGISLAARGMLGILAFGVLLLVTASTVAAASGSMLTTAAVLVFHDLRKISWADLIAGSTTDVWRVASKSMSLGLTTLLGSIYTALPRYLLKVVAGDVALGYYAALTQLPLVGAVIVRSMGEAATPEIARHYNENRAEGLPGAYWRAIKATAGLYAVGMGLSLFAGATLLRLLYTPNHSAYAGLLVFVVLAEGVLQLNAIQMFAATARRCLALQPVALALGLLIMAAAGTYALPVSGLAGLVYVTLLSNMVLLCAYSWLLWAHHSGRGHAAVGEQ